MKKTKRYISQSSDKTIDLIRKILLSSDIKKIGFDIKSQIKILRKYNITEIENFFDISIAHYLLQPDMRHNIDLLAENYLGQSSMDINSVLGKGKNKRSMSELSKEKQIIILFRINRHTITII